MQVAEGGCEQSVPIVEDPKGGQFRGDVGDELARRPHRGYRSGPCRLTTRLGSSLKHTLRVGETKRPVSANQQTRRLPAEQTERTRRTALPTSDSPIPVWRGVTARAARALRVASLRQRHQRKAPQEARQFVVRAAEH